MRYSLSNIAHIVGGTLRGRDREVRDIVTDSRVSSGCGSLFVAMRGENHDSHSYISQMVGRGVESFVVERDDVEALAESDLSYIVVEHSIAALQLLAAHHRREFEGEVVAITGSNGKTTIKEWVAQLAPSGVKIFRSPRSYNSQLGVALSLLMIEGDEELAIIEAGISRPAEMAKLEAMIRPDTVVVTSIGEAHQEGFASTEEKIAEKMILAQRAKRVIYHSAYTELIPHIIYGKWQTIDAAESSGAESGDEATLRNTQIIASLLHTLGFARPTFESIRPLAMRLEMIDGLSDSLIINDSYNSDINSLTIALDALNANALGRPTTVILSDILQSGTPSEELYGRVAAVVTRAKIERVIGVGSQITASRNHFAEGSKFFASTEELLSKITTDDYAGRALLLKGNRESRFETISHRLSRQSHTTTLEVNLDSMVKNLNHYRSHLSPTTRLVAMVKASSYGAGEEEVAQILQHQGVDYLAVAFADEGCRLRERGVTMPIIVLNADDGSFSQMVDMRLEPEIYSLRSLRHFAKAVGSRGERGYPIHLKIDSGMHRLGFMEEGVEELKQELELYGEELKVASIFSHLAESDMGEEGRANTLSQIELFERVSEKIAASLPYPTLRHIANSAAITHYPEAHFDMCRLGIGLYGFGEEGLHPVSTLKSRIVQIREIEQGAMVGYGGVGVAERRSRIATIPVGYADGIDRHLGGGRWSLLVCGKSAPTIGRICMDSLMVDITDIERAEEGDEVLIFSPHKGNTAADMARQLDTISYEVLTSISTRVKRIYIKE
ncbi:MAG: alanine racemase [Rikenellaceae bacterium]